MSIEIEPTNTETPQFVPPGHFYSPITSFSEIKANEHVIFCSSPANLEGIELRGNDQRVFLDALKEYYDTMPYKPIEAISNEIGAYIKRYMEEPISSEKEKIKQEAIVRYNELIREHKPKSTRYLLDNPSYGYTDGIVYHCILRKIKPTRVIEIGAGYSSCLLLDTNEKYFDSNIKCTFIEPYIDNIVSLINEEDKGSIDIIGSKIQDVDINIFKALEKNDILFVDSSHICKTYSDVNHILFNILPLLQSGVYVHFHDVFWPFEYPKEWVYEGRSWNECYLLRAFLSYNTKYSIKFYTSYIQAILKDHLENSMPLLMRGEGGSIWLQKM